MKGTNICWSAPDGRIDGEVYGKNIWSNFVTLLDIHDSDIERITHRSATDNYVMMSVIIIMTANSQLTNFDNEMSSLVFLFLKN